MLLENKLHIADPLELAHEEERLSKIRALELFEKGLLKTYAAGSVDCLFYIHSYIFQDIYPFAGKLRTVNIAKGNFRFAPLMYLQESLHAIEQMPQTNFDEIVDKYVEMNVAHPFREGNGRSMRIWLDLMFKTELGHVIEWSKVDKEDYLLAMERSPIRTIEIKHVLQTALTDKIDDREVYMRSIDASYLIEGFGAYKADELHVLTSNEYQNGGSNVLLSNKFIQIDSGVLFSTKS